MDIRRHRAIPVLAALAATALFGACDGENGFPGLLAPIDTGAGAAVAFLDIDPGVVRLSEVGESVQLDASALDADGTVLEHAVVTWSSSDVNVATVSSGGLVTAVGDGSATITAISGGVEATAVVTVALTTTGTGTP